MGSKLIRKQFISILAEKMKGYLPKLDNYSFEYQMVGYAYRDFEEWMKFKWNLFRKQDIYNLLEQSWEKNPEELKALLNIWASLWLEKWKKRVKLVFSKPKISAEVFNRIKGAKSFYNNMEQKKELKNLLTRMLIGKNEICMTEFIAENLIIEEIAKTHRCYNCRLTNHKITPFELFKRLSYRIMLMSNETGPLIYLNVKPHVV